MRLTHIDTILMSNMKVTKIVQKHFLCTFWEFLVAIICDLKIDVNMGEPHYVNLFFLWTSSVVHVFDFLTFDIFLTTWHLFDNLISFWQLDIFFDMCSMGHMCKWVSWLILKIEMGHLGWWGTLVMGHMANGAHGQWDTWVMGHGQSGIMVNIKDRDGVPWGMGHMGDGVYGQWGTWAIGHMIITSLILHGSL